MAFVKFCCLFCLFVCLFFDRILIFVAVGRYLLLLHFYPRIHLLIYSLVQFNCSVVSNSLRSHELEHARPPCPSPSPGVHSNSCPSSRWCHPTISSSVIYYLDAKEDKTKVAEKWYHRKSKRDTNPCVQVYYT